MRLNYHWLIAASSVFIAFVFNQTFLSTLNSKAAEIGFPLVSSSVAMGGGYMH